MFERFGEFDSAEEINLTAEGLKTEGDMEWSFKNQIPVDKDILKEAKVNASRVTLGIPGMGEAKKIIKSYYTEVK